MAITASRASAAATKARPTKPITTNTPGEKLHCTDGHSEPTGRTLKAVVKRQTYLLLLLPPPPGLSYCLAPGQVWAQICTLHFAPETVCISVNFGSSLRDNNNNSFSDRLNMFIVKCCVQTCVKAGGGRSRFDNATNFVTINLFSPCQCIGKCLHAKAPDTRAQVAVWPACSAAADAKERDRRLEPARPVWDCDETLPRIHNK